MRIREATGPDTQHELAPLPRPMLQLGGLTPKTLVILHYGPLCACCGTPDNPDHPPSRLEIDHIDGKGKAHRAKIGIAGGPPFYRWLIRNGFPPGYQVLCHECNMSKGTEERCGLHRPLRWELGERAYRYLRRENPVSLRPGSPFDRAIKAGNRGYWQLRCEEAGGHTREAHEQMRRAEEG